MYHGDETETPGLCPVTGIMAREGASELGGPF